MKNGLYKLFWGLLLQFITVNAYNLDIYLPMLGTILIVTALWQLRYENKSFRSAYTVSLFHLAIIVGKLFLFCSVYANNTSLNLLFNLSGAFMMVIVMFNIFRGLGLLVSNATGSKVSYNACFFWYLIATGTSLFILFMGMDTISLIATIPYIIIFLYILIKVYKAAKLVYGSTYTLNVSPLTKRYAISLCAAILIIALSVAGLLYISNTDPVSVQPYNKANVISLTDLSSVRDKMISAGFDKNIMADLTERELHQYNQITKFESVTEKKDIDGGTLQLTLCFSTLNAGSIRVLAYYNWLKAPRHCFTDSFRLALYNNQKLISPHLFQPESVVNLYKDNTGKTYEVNAVYVENTVMTIAEKIKVFGGASSQRGYVAKTITVNDPDYSLQFAVDMVYVHQYNLFNFKHRDPLELYRENTLCVSCKDFPFYYASLYRYCVYEASE